MERLTQFYGIAAPLLEDNIDTDQLCPKQHLKRLVRSGFGPTLFSDRRFHPDGSERPEFLLNQAPWRNASILVAGDNFGSGSSREHAVWALADYGFRCIVAPSFGDIFFQNCVNSGVLAVRMSRAQVESLAEAALRSPGAPWEVDLTLQLITPALGEPVRFEIEPGRRERLMAGLDEIALTLQRREAVAAFEARQKSREPWLWQPLLP